MKESLNAMEEISFELGKLHSRTRIVAAHSHGSKQLTGDFRFTFPMGAHTLSSWMRRRKHLLLKLSVCLTVRNQLKAWNLSPIRHFLNATLWLADTQPDSVFRVFLSLNIVKFLPSRHYMVMTPTVSGDMKKNILSALNCAEWSFNLMTQPKFLTRLLFITRSTVYFFISPLFICTQK